MPATASNSTARRSPIFGERIVEVACWAHARRKIFEVHQSTNSPVAADALKTIADLYRIETAIRGRPPDLRREVRQERTKPLLTALHGWLTAQLSRLPPKGGLAEAFRYALGNWTALTRFVDACPRAGLRPDPWDGRLEIDNNRAENTIRSVALGRKNGCSRDRTPAESVPPPMV
jgi:transposase